MKKTILSAFIGALIAITLGAALIDSKASATVEKIQGVYIFVKSKPALDYEHLGTLKGPTIGSHEFDDLLTSILKKAKKEYPEADGLIFDGPIKQTHNTTVSVIKFK